MAYGESVWIDPRSNPKGPYAGPPRPLAKDHGELSDLVSAMRAGRFYDVEAWVAAGKPLQTVTKPARSTRRNPSPFRVAMDEGWLDVVRLFLCNGYRMDLDVDPPLDLALSARRWDLLELLLDWGADPASADIGLVLDTYQREIMERFREAGVDLTAGDVMADSLARSTRNRALYGFVKNHRMEDPRIQRAVDVALGEAITGRKDKAVSLCLWAGANPRQRVGGLFDPPEEDLEARTGIERAVSAGVPKYLKKFGFDPARDPVQPLYHHAHDLDCLRLLTSIEPPNDWNPILHRIIRNLSLSRRLSITFARIGDLTNVFGLGAHLGWLDSYTKRELRQLLLTLPEYQAQELFRLLKSPDHMDPEVFLDLIAHEKLAARYMDHRRGWGIDKEILEGLVAGRRVPGPVRRWARAQLHPPRPVMTHTFLEPKAGEGRLYTREELYALVWSEPLVVLAARFGISDNGLRKRCKAMHVPTPPRGYWEKVKHGCRIKRAQLPQTRGEGT